MVSPSLWLRKVYSDITVSHSVVVIALSSLQSSKAPPPHPLAISTVCNPVQFSKALPPIVFTVEGITILLKETQSIKHSFGISVIEFSGIVTLFKLSQFSNAEAWISDKLSGIVTLVRLSQFEKAYSPIVSTELPIFNSFNFVQLLKAYPPISVTPLPITTFSKPSQPRKAP